MPASCDISDRHCKPCEGGVAPLGREEAEKLLAGLEGWQLQEGWIEKNFAFTNHYKTMAFVNAVAWISHREDHHPEMVVGYAECRVRYSTHAIDGLSENDFICAAKVDRLLTL